MSLSATIDEAYFLSILDRGLQQLKHSATALPRYDQSVNTAKLFSRTAPAFRINEPTQAKIEAKAFKDLATNQAQSESLQSELSALKARLIALESTVKKPSISYKTLAPDPPLHRLKASKSSNLSLRSSLRNSSVDFFLKDIERSEKEISQIEFNISRIGKSEHSAKAELEQSNTDLIDLRRQHIELTQERESLSKKVAHRTDYLSRLKRMEEDFAALKVSYEKSKEIRARQSELIEQLKGEVRALTITERAPVVKKVVPQRRRSSQKKLVHL